MSKTAILLLSIILLIITFISFPSVSNAAENNIAIKDEMINPGSFYYSFKRAWEKIVVAILFWPQAKLNYQNYLLDVRMSEFKKIAEDRELNEFQKSSERLSYQAGILTDLVENSQDEEDKKLLRTKLKSFSEILAKLRDQYSANTSFWLLAQQNIDTFKILSNRLK